MSASRSLIERLSLAIVGSQRDDVLEVLAAFTRTLLDQWGVAVDVYVAALRADPLVKDRDVH